MRAFGLGVKAMQMLIQIRRCKTSQENCGKRCGGALEPHIEFVVTCGTIAASVFDFVGGKRKKLRSPSPNAMSRVSGMFRKDDLLERYPEVKTAYEEMKFDKNDISYEQNKIFYACHVVSLLKVRLSR